ncbi:hypothetical protein [Saprospira grandis]|uniref:hypothetical protein n=1 Tax=Saprospira grandis TaxID=1008 RepID=UPI0022DD4812|nr:hypothetical protein [Saprospira grandis]WBM73956.1 hypothetical protein OP864_13270 [Saprospira grandis]
MAFKSKIKLDELKNLTEVQYIKLIEREVKRAAAFGQTGVIVLSDYTFSCGSLGTLILLGKLSGSLMKYYKGLKTDRKAEKDFAKGVCYFQEVEGQPPIMRIALNDGKGKPAKMKKNGKKLFKKLGFTVDIFKGDLGLQEVGLEAEEIDQIEAEVEQENDDQKMISIIRAYKKTFALVAKNVIPILKAKTPEKIEERHYQLSLRLLKLSKSLQDKLEEISEKKQEKYSAFVAEVKAKEPRLIKIVAKLKQHLKNRTVEGNLDEVRGELHTLLNDLNQSSNKLQSLKNELKTKFKAYGISI